MTETNYPITEAVCEFRVEQEEPWDAVLVGHIYDRLKQNFPKRTPLKRLHAKLSSEAMEDLNQFLSFEEAIQFLSEDESDRTIIGPHVFSISRTQPYEGWDPFFERIVQVFRSYNDAAGIRSVKRIGLRYVNHIHFPEGRNLEDFFNFRPYVDMPGIEDYSSFIVGIQVSLPDREGTIKAQLFRAQKQRPTFQSVVFDLDHFVTEAPMGDPEQALEWVKRAHERLKQFYSNALKEELKQCIEENWESHDTAS